MSFQWDPERYLRFAQERILAVRDLVARLALRLPARQVRTIIDLGSGPGNSTAVLQETWPQASVTGLDAAAVMLKMARETHPGIQFAAGDITAWASEDGARHDLVFSNSALQWVPEHARLLPQLLRRVASGGALAFQVPADWEAAAVRLPREMAASAGWKGWFPPGTIQEWHTATLGEFYEMLAPHAAEVELWETTYVLVMADAEAIINWYLGSGLRQYMAALPDEDRRQGFREEYLQGLRGAYPPQPDGRVLFPFLRRFVIARG